MSKFNIVLAKQYNYDQWQEMIVGKPARFIWQFLLQQDIFPGWKLNTSLPIRSEEGQVTQTQLWLEDQTENGSQLRIDVISCSSQQKAMETMLEVLGDFQGPILSDSRKLDLFIGDVAYTGQTEAPAFLVFLQANMVVRILNAGQKISSVLPFARQLNGLWVGENEHHEDQKIKPEFKSFTIAEEKPIPSKPIRLLFDAKDLLNRPLWYRMSAAEGEFLSEGDQVFFQNSRKGKFEIQAEAINPNGGSAQAALEITID